MKNFLFSLFDFSARALSRLSRIFLHLERRWKPTDFQYRSVVHSTRYNMMEAPNEPYYTEQYWQVILPHLSKLHQEARIIDLGCGQGRFTVKLGKFFTRGQIKGCDLSEEAVSQAKNYASRDSVTNIDLKVQSIADCLKNFSEKTVDAILINEVTFFYPHWKQDLPHIIQALKPGGILIISFRPQYFYALYLVRNRLWEEVESVLKNRQGAILESSTLFTWQTSDEIRNLLTQEYGLILLELQGIGTCSGIPQDPHDHICQPSHLNAEEKEQLMKLELELGKKFPDGGRYILAVASKPEP